jgi:hypothetical protein
MADFHETARTPRALAIAGKVYGTVVVLGVIAASSPAETEPSRIAALVLVTSVVFWLAHVYSQILATSIEAGRHARASDVRTIAAHEASVLYAAVLPVAALLLGAFDVVRDATAVWLAIAAGIGVLVAQGIAYARIERFGATATIGTVSVNVVLGLSLALLKALVGH